MIYSDSNNNVSDRLSCYSLLRTAAMITRPYFGRDLVHTANHFDAYYLCRRYLVSITALPMR